MNHPQWQELSPTQYALSGSLDRDSIPSIWAEFKQWPFQQDTMQINLTNVERIDSATLALLIQLIKKAKENQCKLLFNDLPEQLNVLIEISNVTSMMSEHIIPK